MEEIAQPLLDKDSSSEFERKPKVEKLRYFNKASAFSKLFFNWIIELISVPIVDLEVVWKQTRNRTRKSWRSQDEWQSWSRIRKLGIRLEHIQEHRQGGSS